MENTLIQNPKIKIMKKFFALLFLGSLFTLSFAQSDANPSVDFNNNTSGDENTNAVKKGNILIEPWYGFPLWGKELYTSIVDTTGGSYRGLGPLGATLEFMLADDVGIGVDFIYNSHAYRYTAQSVNAQGDPITYNYDWKMERVRIHLRMNYHFSQSEDLDAYFGVGVGSNNRFFTTKSNDPNWDDSTDEGALLPVSARICVGTRYYFNSNLELILGIPLIITNILNTFTNLFNDSSNCLLS